MSLILTTRNPYVVRCTSVRSTSYVLSDIFIGNIHNINRNKDNRDEEDEEEKEDHDGDDQDGDDVEDVEDDRIQPMSTHNCRIVLAFPPERNNRQTWQSESSQQSIITQIL